MNIGFIYALLSAVMFSTLGVLNNSIKHYNIETNTLLLYYSFLSTLLLFFFAYKNRKEKLFKIKKNELVNTAIYGGVFCLFLANILSLISLKYIDSGIQRLITYSNPIFIVLINKFVFNKKIKRNILISLVLMFSGLIFIVSELDFNANNGLIYGLIYSLTAALVTAIYSVITERQEEESKLDTYTYWFYSFFFAFIYSFLFAVIDGTIHNLNKIFTIDLIGLLLLSCIAIFNFLLPYVFFYKAIEKIGSEKTGIIMTLTIVFSILLGVIFLHERLTILQLFGGALIIIASYLSGKKS